MLAAFLIVLREGFEATLLLAIVLAYLTRIGREDGKPGVWYGVAAAVGLSIVVGVAMFATASSLKGDAGEIFKGVAMWFAVAVLTYMIVWMRRQSRSMAYDLRSRVDAAVESHTTKGGSVIALAALAFVMVFREGLETALFMFGITQVSSPSHVLIGSAAGLVGAVGLGYAVYVGGRRINMGLFFRATGGLLLVVAAGLLAHGMVMFQSASVIPAFFWPIWDLSHIQLLTHESFFGQFIIAFLGWDPKPDLLELVAWGGYLSIVGYFFFRPLPATAPRTAEASN